MVDSSVAELGVHSIASRLFPLVRERAEWWRDAVRRWAGNPPLHGKTHRALPIPFPNDTKLMPSERLAILAAIHDTFATADSRIDPWPTPWEWEGSSKGDKDAVMRWTGLLGRVATDLPECWLTHQATVELFITELELQIANVPLLTKEAASVLSFLGRRHPVLSSLDDIEGGAEVSRTTAQKSTEELIAAKYADRPHGPNKGVAATAAGMAVATKLSSKSYQS